MPICTPAIFVDPSITQRGADVVMECSVEANPLPQVTWYRDDKEIKPNDTYAMKVTPITDGTGPDKYRIICEISNFDKSLGGIYKSVIANDQGSTSSTYTVSAGDAPEMTEKPKIVQKDGGKAMAIKIRAKSKTEPKAEWTKDDKPIKDSDRIKQTMQKDDKEADQYIFLCEIKMPMKEDEGKYRCTVSNGEGSNSQSLNLSFD